MITLKYKPKIKSATPVRRFVLDQMRASNDFYDGIYNAARHHIILPDYETYRAIINKLKVDEIETLRL